LEVEIMSSKYLSKCLVHLKGTGWYRKLRSLRSDLVFIPSQILLTPKMGLMSTDYDLYWQDKRKDGTLGVPGSFQVQRIEWILPRIREGDTVAEFGCGDAATLIALTKFKRIKAIGLDISKHALSFAAQNEVETHLLKAGEIDFDSLPEADVYLLLEVLEHFPNPEIALTKILAKSRKKVIVSIPNTGYFPYRLRLLSGRFPVQWRLHPSEHLRFWTLADFQWWLGELGLIGSSTVVTYKGMPWMNRLFPGLFGMGILCEIRK
jgi:SAM-dependent methyltransferase